MPPFHNLASPPRRNLAFPNEVLYMIVDLLSEDPVTLFHLMLGSKALYSQAMPILLQKHSLPRSIEWIYHRLSPARCTSFSPDAIEPCEIELATSVLSRIGNYRSLDELPLVPVECRTMPIIKQTFSYTTFRPPLFRAGTTRYECAIPFLSAVSAFGLESIVDVVLRHGGNPNPYVGSWRSPDIGCTGCDGPCSEAFSPLFMAVSQGRKTTAATLINAGATVLPNVWKYALIGSQTAITESLIDSYPLLAQQSIRTIGYGNICPVGFAALSQGTGVVPTLRLLIQHGSPLMSRSSAHGSSITAFETALKHGSEDAVRFLASYATSNDLALLCAGYRFLPSASSWHSTHQPQKRNDGCLEHCLTVIRLAGVRPPSQVIIRAIHRDLCEEMYASFEPEEIVSHGFIVCRALGLREAPLLPSWRPAHQDALTRTQSFIGRRPCFPSCALPDVSMTSSRKPAYLAHIIPCIRRVQAADVSMPSTLNTHEEGMNGLAPQVPPWELPLHNTSTSPCRCPALETFEPPIGGGPLGDGWWPLEWSPFELPSVSWVGCIFESTLYQERRHDGREVWSPFVHQPILTWAFSVGERSATLRALSVVEWSVPPVSRSIFRALFFLAVYGAQTLTLCLSIVSHRGIAPSKLCSYSYMNGYCRYNLFAVVRAPFSNQQCRTEPDHEVASHRTRPRGGMRHTPACTMCDHTPLLSVMSVDSHFSDWGPHLKCMASWHRQFRIPATHGPVRSGPSRSPRPLAGIVVMQHIWIVVPTAPDSDDQGPAAYILGSTETPAAIYKLVVALQLLRTWAENHPSISPDCSSH